MKKIVLVLMALVFVAACTMTSASRPQPRFAYKQYPATRINVANIEVRENYTMPMQAPNVEHLMPLPMPQAIGDWARSRFVATGATGTMVITIQQANVLRKDLPRTDGVKGWFTVDQAERYDSRVVVEFSVDGIANHSGSGVVNATRGQTIGENASIQERDQAWTRMSETLMTDLDAATQKLLQDRMAFALN
jgi:hypothetical protein